MTAENNKIKFYKNPKRNKSDDVKPYIPQYQQLKIDPVDVGNNFATDNPRLARAPIRQPYSNTTSLLGNGKLPNVGNNVEQSWVAIDGQIIDDISDVDLNHPMIDNNDFISAEAMGLPSMDNLENTKTFLTENELRGEINNDDFSFSVKNVEENNYLLIVNNEIICSGSLDDIQEQASNFLFGSHPLCDGVPVSIDDIIVLKRVQIKVGLFLS